MFTNPEIPNTTMAYDLPILRKQLLPPLADVSKAMQKADSRDEKGRDVRPLMAILMRLSDADPRLGGHLLTRQTAVTSFDWVLEGGEDAPREKAAERLRGVLDHLMSRITEVPLYGAMAWRQEWAFDLEHGAQVPVVLQDYDPDEIERPTRNREDVRLLSWQGSAVTRTPVADDDPTYVVAIDRRRAVQGGVLRTLAIREVLLNMSLQEWSGFLRKLKGLIGAQHRGGVPEAGDPERATSETALQTFTDNNYALYSDQVKFELTKLVDAAGGAAFQAYKQELEADIAVAVLGQANTAALPASGGSRAALEVLNLIRRDIHHADIRLAEEVAARQLLDRDYRINEDKAAAKAPWRLRVKIEQDEDPEANARAVGEAVTALDDTGAGLLATEVYARLGYTVPPGTPAVLMRSSPAPVPGIG